MRLIISSLILLAAASPAAAQTDPDKDWLEQGLSAQVSQFYSSTFTPQPARKQIVAVNCEREHLWWSELRVVYHTGDKIDWLAKLPADYVENRGHYLLAFKWQRLDKLGLWVLEVFDSTHMGNGSLWLFALDGQELRVLLHTPALGRHWNAAPALGVPQGGEARFAENHLKVEYRLPKGADHEIVYISGTIAIVDAIGKELPPKAYAETWLWDPPKRAFKRIEP